MAKLKEKVARPGEQKTKETKETKDKETKGKSKLVGRVKKVIKKSRRRLGEEKFEKELQRTIEFLGQLQTKLGALHAARENGKAPAKVEKKTALKAVTKVEKKGDRNAPKKGQHDKKNGKKSAGHDANGGNGVGKKRKGLQIKDASPAAAPIALQVEASSKGR
jgi:hypothetical protein